MGSKLSRRSLLWAAAVAPGNLGAVPAPGHGSAHQRAEEAFNVRVDAALQEDRVTGVTHIVNGDEAAYASRIGNFSKGLPHNALGEVDPGAYSIFLLAMESAPQMADVERIPMGSSDPALQMKLVNPCAGADFSLQGADSHHLSIPPAPLVDSAWAAGEMVELYWMALARDVAFTDYETHPVTQAASRGVDQTQHVSRAQSGRRCHTRDTLPRLYRGRRTWAIPFAVLAPACAIREPIRRAAHAHGAGEKRLSDRL